MGNHLMLILDATMRTDEVNAYDIMGESPNTRLNERSQTRKYLV